MAAKKSRVALPGVVSAASVSISCAIAPRQLPADRQIERPAKLDQAVGAEQPYLVPQRSRTAFAGVGSKMAVSATPLSASIAGK
jgi:hypothetical protein